MPLSTYSHRSLQKLTSKDESSNMVSYFQSFVKDIMSFSLNHFLFLILLSGRLIAVMLFFIFAFVFCFVLIE